jgi:hypothetical protein
VREEEVDNSPQFTPQYFSVPLQDFEGSARQSTDKSSQIHIARQSKARKEKKEQLDRFVIIRMSNIVIIFEHKTLTVLLTPFPINSHRTD